MRPDELRIVSKVPRHRGGFDDFWKDTYIAEVKQKSATVKVYYDRSGGEAAFIRDVKLLGENV